MAKRGAKIPNITDKTCRFGKISNNLEKHGKNWETAFTIPISELNLTKAELNALLRDKYAHQSWFDTSKPGAVEPMAWWNEETFSLRQDFEADELTITVSGDNELEFESSGDAKEDNYRAACRISDIVLFPQVGGMTEMQFKLYVLPQLGKTNLQLQEHQKREVKISWKDARAVEAASKQPELPMGDQSAPPAGAAPDASATH